MNRRTIARPVSLQGIGLHLGAECRLSFRPAVSGAGIFFRRADLADRPTIPALAERAVLAEPPIMDGSSAPFVEALLSAGIVEHNGGVKATYLTLRRPLRLVDGESVY